MAPIEGGLRHTPKIITVDAEGNLNDPNLSQKEQRGILPPIEMQLAYFTKYTELRARIPLGLNGGLTFYHSEQSDREVSQINTFFGKKVASSEYTTNTQLPTYKVRLDNQVIESLYDKSAVATELKKLTNAA